MGRWPHHGFMSGESVDTDIEKTPNNRTEEECNEIRNDGGHASSRRIKECAVRSASVGSCLRRQRNDKKI